MLKESEVEEELRGMGFSVPVAEWRVRAGEDHRGVSALWVWAILEQGDLSSEVCNEISDAVWERLTAAHEPEIGWVYVRFRAVGEEEGV
jgi:hypothetical protein